jgi:signal peptidase II
VRAPSDASKAVAVAVISIAADQLSKALVRAEIHPGETVAVLPGLDLVHVWNRGIAFGMLDSAGPVVIVVAALALGLVLAIILGGSRRQGLWLPIGLLAGGAVGNLIDRIRLGHVTDFIDLPAWPSFNLADVQITAAVLILLFIYLRAPAKQ